MNPQKVTVSIIIPIYNAELYLQRCLDSLLKQTFQDFEIIAINDGSTDGSQKILDKYSKNDSRFKIISKDNEGLSATRNLGLQLAQGRHILFVDADDWLNEDCLAKLLDASKLYKDAFVMCSYVREYIGSSAVKKINLPEITYYSNQMEVKEGLLRRLVGPIESETERPDLLHSFGTAWGKLYSTEILKNHKINFEELSVIGTEDELFNIQYFIYEDKAVILNIPLYHYWKGKKGNLTSTYKPKLPEQWCVLFELIGERLGKLMLDDKFKKALENRIALSVLGLGLNVCCSNNNPPFRLLRFELKRILSKPQISSALSNLELSPLPIHWKMFYYCAKHRLVIPLYILLKIINRLRRFS